MFEPLGRLRVASQAKLRPRPHRLYPLSDVDLLPLRWVSTFPGRMDHLMKTIILRLEQQVLSNVSIEFRVAYTLA